MITRLKFESYHDIIKGKKKLDDQEIIRIAKEEYDCNLTIKDLEEMRKNFEDFMYKYIN